MSRQHGITSETFNRILIDSGELRFGYIDESNPGYRIGATRGGNSFVIEQEYHSAIVDGEKGDVKGGKRIIKINAIITANVIELVPWIMCFALPGATTEEGPGGLPDYIAIARALKILLSNYGSTVALIGQVNGKSEPIICGINNTMAIGSFDIALIDNDESVLKIQFIAHFDPDDLDTEPWFIRLPKESSTVLSLWKGEDNGNNEVAGKPAAVWNYLDAYATGKVGRCFRVREVPWPEGGGSDLTKLTIANDSSYNFDPAGTFSVEFWFNNTTIVDEWGDGGSGILFEQLKEGYVDPASNLWAIRYDDGNTLAIYFKFGENIFSQNYPSAFVINEWIKIKMEYDGISNPGEGRWNLYTSTDGVTWNLLTPGEGSTICTDQYCFYTPLLTTFQIGPTGSGEFHSMEFLIDEVQVN